MVKTLTKILNLLIDVGMDDEARGRYDCHISTDHFNRATDIAIDINNGDQITSEMLAEVQQIADCYQ